MSVSKIYTKAPLVSVGIPTFNRPEGLRRTLRCICAQTYSNIEIIVSDNASAGTETEVVAREFSEQDARIKYFRQPSNIGSTENFRFLLKNASGEYFMWAADDDEWDASFIETCLAATDPPCSVMTKFSTVLRARNIREEKLVPQLSPDASLSQNVMNFFSIMQPSLFYGLHHRKSILFFLTGKCFDFYDCYAVLRIILESGFRTIDRNLFTAGVDGISRKVKYANMAKKRLEFWPFFLHCSIALARSSGLSGWEKMGLWIRLLQVVRSLRRHHAARAS
jgi:glycosyltransferase involved in cell wall biosynthesis